MPSRGLIFLLLLSAGTPFVLAQCGTQPSDFYVAKIVFERHGHLTSDEEASVRAALIGQCFDQSGLHKLGEVAYEKCRDFGYFRARVPDPIMRVIDEAQRPKPAKLVLDVDEGPKYVIDSVIWSGIRAFPVKDIQEMNPAQPGDLYSRSKVDAAVDAVKRFYIASGFPDVAITPSVETTEQRLHLIFKVDEGQHVGPP